MTPASLPALLPARSCRTRGSHGRAAARRQGAGCARGPAAPGNRAGVSRAGQRSAEPGRFGIRLAGIRRTGVGGPGSAERGRAGLWSAEPGRAQTNRGQPSRGVAGSGSAPPGLHSLHGVNARSAGAQQTPQPAEHPAGGGHGAQGRSAGIPRGRARRSRCRSARRGARSQAAGNAQKRAEPWPRTSAGSRDAPTPATPGEPRCWRRESGESSSSSPRPGAVPSSLTARHRARRFRHALSCRPIVGWVGGGVLVESSPRTLRRAPAGLPAAPGTRERG